MVVGMSSSEGAKCPFALDTPSNTHHPESTSKSKSNNHNPTPSKFTDLPSSTSITASIGSSSSSSLTNTLTTTPSSSSTTILRQAYEMAKSSCPAFRNDSCPFKNLTTQEELRKKLKEMPPSHITVVKRHQRNRIRSIGSEDDGERDEEEEGDEGAEMELMGDSMDIMEDPLIAALQNVRTVSQFASSSLTSSNATSPSPSSTEAESCPFRSFADQMEGLSVQAVIANMLEPTFVRKEQMVERTEEGNRLLGSVPSLSTPSSDRFSPPPSTTTTTPTTIPSSSPSNRRASLSESLKTGTAVSHSSAESVHFVKEFVRGNIDRTLYSRLVLDLYFVYQTLERLLETYAVEWFPTVHFPKELGRMESLREDVEFFLGDGFLDYDDGSGSVGGVGVGGVVGGGGGGSPSPATKDYVARLEWIAKTEPTLLVSHAYTRYMGDLSGGTVLARVARNALNLKPMDSDNEEEEDGLRFYHFEHISSPVRFKNEYRKALDALPVNLDPDVVERLVAEANVAFVLNVRIFEELDVMGGVKGSTVRPLSDAVRYYQECVERQERERLLGGVKDRREDEQGMAGENEEDSKIDKCPFGITSGPNPHGTTGMSDSTMNVRTVSDTKVNETNIEGRCPWPFVFFHDPATGMRDYQTWVVVALVSCWIWNFVQQKAD